MLRGIYTAVAGMATEMNDMNILSNNISNDNTVGFKGDFETLVRDAANPLSYGMGGLVRGTGVLHVVSSLDLSQGALTQTGNQLDVALQGQGMFGMQLGASTLFTRNGRFHVTATGQLALDNGGLVLDVNQKPIQIPDPQGQAITIHTDGTIQIGNATVGRIGVFTTSSFIQNGNAQYSAAGPVTTVNTTIRQGLLEQSNVDLTSTMGAVMTSERAYNASSQFLKFQDQILQQTVNDVGKVQ